MYNPLLLEAPLTLWVPRDVDMADIPLTVLDQDGNTVAFQVMGWG